MPVEMVIKLEDEGTEAPPPSGPTPVPPATAPPSLPAGTSPQSPSLRTLAPTQPPTAPLPPGVVGSPFLGPADPNVTAAGEKVTPVRVVGWEVGPIDVITNTVRDGQTVRSGSPGSSPRTPPPTERESVGKIADRLAIRFGLGGVSRAGQGTVETGKDFGKLATAVATVGPAATAATAALGGTAAAAAGVIVAAGATAAGLGALTFAASKAADKLADFDPRIAFAKADEHIADIMGNLRRASLLGDELAAFIQVRSRVGQAVSDTSAKLLEVFLQKFQPLLDDIAKFLETSGEDLVQLVREGAPAIQFVAETLRNILGILNELREMAAEAFAWWQGRDRAKELAERALKAAAEDVKFQNEMNRFLGRREVPIAPPRAAAGAAPVAGRAAAEFADAVGDILGLFGRGVVGGLGGVLGGR